MKSVFILIVSLCGLVASAQTASKIIAGNQYYRQGAYDLAEAQYRLAVEGDPSNETAQYNLANALQMQKKYDEAAKILEKLASSSKDTMMQAAAYYNQGVAYTKLKNLESSIESYKNALRKNPEDQEARENLQKALLELKQKQQQQNQQKQKQDPRMSQKEADQKLKLLQQKERELQQRQQNRNKKAGNGQSQDW